MSPGPTFERVYLELKRQLREGTRSPGTPLEPTAIGDELGTSFTPVRDALHRLVGEGLVENPKQNGFSVPQPTEQALRDLYGWNGELLALCLAKGKASTAFAVEGEDTASRAEALFAYIASQTGNREHAKVVAQLNDRLAPYRQAEGSVLPNLDAELVQLSAAIDGQSATEAKATISRYHKRRIAAASQILGALIVA